MLWMLKVQAPKALDLAAINADYKEVLDRLNFRCLYI